jgi:hypothetical protein
MAGGLAATTDVERIEAPVTMKAYMMCAFASFGGIFFGYDSGYISGVMGMPYFIRLYVSQQTLTLSSRRPTNPPNRLVSKSLVPMLLKPKRMLSLFPLTTSLSSLLSSLLVLSSVH